MAVGFIAGKTVYADSEFSASYPKASASDNLIAKDVFAANWASSATAPPHWWAVDLGSGITKIGTSCLIAAPVYNGSHLKDFKIQGSNNSTDGSDGTWVDLYTGLHADNDSLQKYSWSNSTGYRWYRVYATSTYRSDGVVGINYIDLFDDDYFSILPLMTADNAPADYVISTSFAKYANGYEAFRATNGEVTNNQSVLAGQVTTGVITIDLGANNGHIVSGYTIMPQSKGTGRAPKNWTFQGSNDNSSWTTLDTRSNVTGWTSYRVDHFTFSNSTSYRYYRWDVTANNGDGSYLTIQNLQLLGNAGGGTPPASTGILYATFI